MGFVGEPLRTKRHDTAALSDVLERETTPGSGTFIPIDLTGSTVRFLVSTIDGDAVYGGDATIEDAVSGIVSYAPTAEQSALTGFADGDFPLALRAEWEWTDTDGRVKTIPEGKDYRKLVVGLDLG